MARVRCFICSITAWLVFLSLLCGDGTAPAEGPPPDAEVERLYNAWLRFLDEPTSRASSGSLQTENAHFRAIVERGPKAVPFLIAKLDSEPSPAVSSFIMEALWRVTRARPVSREEARGTSTHARAKAWVTWFRSLDLEMPARFDERAAAWRRFAREPKPVLWTEAVFYDAPLGGLRTRRQATAAGRAYKAMLDLGIAALPLVVQRLRMGETCFIPIFEELTGSGASVHGPNAEATRRNCMAWWERNRHDWVIPQP